MGGGALLDVGIYCLNIVDMIFGGQEPTSISAMGQKTPAGVDSTVTITMLYAENRTASLTISMGKYTVSQKLRAELFKAGLR